MLSMNVTRRMMSAFAEEEPWKRNHDAVKACWKMEDVLAQGIMLLKWMMEAESKVIRSGATHIEGFASMDEFFAATKSLYETWIEAARRHLGSAELFVKDGYDVQGIDEFRCVLKDAECMVDNLELESQIPPMADLMKLANRGNPDPGRYGDY